MRHPGFPKAALPHPPVLKLALAASLLFLAAAGTQAQPKNFNILFILADDLTRFDLGCYGSKDSRTPAIDNLAGQGMRFTRCTQAVPMCSPTRQNLYTGLYPTRTGAYPNHTFTRPGVRSVVQLLEPLGYRVAMSGKRHFGPSSVYPFEFLDTDSGDGDGPGPVFSAVDGFLADASSRKQRFALFLTSHLPHSPWTKGDRSLFNPNALTLPPHQVDNAATRANFRDYLAEVNALDGQVEAALALLDKHGLADSTVVMFASEQGTSTPFAKWTLYNAGLGSAFIVRWPGLVRPGTVSDALVEYSDVVPTLIDIAGGAPAEGLDGSSLVPLLRGRTTRHKEYSYSMMTTRGINGGSEYFPLRGVVDARYRYIVNYAPEVPFHNAAEMPGWADAGAEGKRLVERYRRRPPVELYDDAGDPWNQRNLAGDPAYDSIRTRLSARLAGWLHEVGDVPFQTELSAFDHMEKRKPFNGDTVLVNQEMADGTMPGNLAPGLRYALYGGEWTTVPDFSGLAPFRTGTVPNFTRTASLPGWNGNRQAVRYTGWVRARTRGFHTFYLETFNPARLSVGGRTVVASAAVTAAEPVRRYGAILLDTGWHALDVVCVGRPVKDSLSVTWSYPGLIAAQGDLRIPDGDLAQRGPTSAPGPRPGRRAGSWSQRGSILRFEGWPAAWEARLIGPDGTRLRRVREPDRLDLSGLPRGVYLLEGWVGGARVAIGKVVCIHG